jgi:hypothetical protein
MLSDILMWNKIGRIVSIVAGKLNISPEKALSLFYKSETCERLHNPDEHLYLMGDLYVADELIIELGGNPQKW